MARSIINETAFTLHLFVDMDPGVCDCGDECYWDVAYSYLHIVTDDSQGRSAQTATILDGDFESRFSRTYDYVLSGKANGHPPIYDVKISDEERPDTSSYFFRARFRYGLILFCFPNSAVLGLSSCRLVSSVFLCVVPSMVCASKLVCSGLWFSDLFSCVTRKGTLICGR